MVARNLREYVCEEAFRRLDAVPLADLRNVTWTRAAALGATTVPTVQRWVMVRGYQRLMIGQAHTPQRPRGVYKPRLTTGAQKQRLRLIADLLDQGFSWETIGDQLGITRQAANAFWKRNRQRITDM